MIDMGRCRDCKHWAGSGPESSGLCKISQNPDGLKIWSIGGFSLRSRPDFGCVQFEKREDSNGD